MSKLAKNLTKLSNDASGSFKTRSDRNKHLHKLSDILRRQNINIEHVSHIKEVHIKQFIEDRKINGKSGKGVSVATLCNEMASIRKVLREAGRLQLANSPNLTNKALGISGRSRIGNKEPIPPEKIKEFIDGAFKKDIGLGICLVLTLLLGLRAEEAVQANKSINTWLKVILRGDAKVRVIFGTKGSRRRDTTIINHLDLLHTVKFAIQIAKERGGVLINKNNLQAAMEYFSNSLRALGMTGKYAPHAMRYTYTDNILYMYVNQGYSEKEAFAMASCDLGHGEQRDRYIKSTYGRTRITNKLFNLSDIGLNIYEDLKTN
jgi:hypothetical protein